MAWYWWLAIALAALLVGGFAFASCGVGRRPPAATPAVVSTQNPEDAMDGISRVYLEHEARGKRLDEFRERILTGSSLEKRVGVLESTDKDFIKMLNCLRGDCGSRTAMVAVPCGITQIQPCLPAPAQPVAPKKQPAVVPTAPKADEDCSDPSCGSLWDKYNSVVAEIRP